MNHVNPLKFRIPNINMPLVNNQLNGITKIVLGCGVLVVGALTTIFAYKLILNGAAMIHEATTDLYEMYCEEHSDSIICLGLKSKQCINSDSCE